VRALRAVEEDEGLAAEEAIAEALKLLREIVGQEFEVEDDEVPRPRRGRRGRQVVSAHEPEMRHGRQTAARPFTGSQDPHRRGRRRADPDLDLRQRRERARRPPGGSARRPTAEGAAPEAGDR
jgi:hypothetical protein